MSECGDQLSLLVWVEAVHHAEHELIGKRKGITELSCLTPPRMGIAPLDERELIFKGLLAEEEDVGSFPFPLRCNPDVKIVEEGLDFMVHWFTEPRVSTPKVSVEVDVGFWRQACSCHIYFLLVCC